MISNKLSKLLVLTLLCNFAILQLNAKSRKKQNHSSNIQISTNKNFSFLGYSEDGTLAAWRIEVVKFNKKKGYQDKYTMIQVIDPWTDKITKVFKASDIKRTYLKNNKSIIIKPETKHYKNIEKNNNIYSAWNEALSKKGWLAYKFHKKFFEPERVI